MRYVWISYCTVLTYLLIDWPWWAWCWILALWLCLRKPTREVLDRDAKIVGEIARRELELALTRARVGALAQARGGLGQTRALMRSWPVTPATPRVCRQPPPAASVAVVPTVMWPAAMQRWRSQQLV